MPELNDRRPAGEPAGLIHRTGTHLRRVNAATYKRDKARQQAKANGS